uniref:Alternative protein RAG2 n=1 Tax=Homo sapiens TaxID=9606 RepID=L0R5C5_HUMAN|nr:alternative protein RAG2 [Homo sapiens]
MILMKSRQHSQTVKHQQKIQGIPLPLKTLKNFVSVQKQIVLMVMMNLTPIMKMMKKMSLRQATGLHAALLVMWISTLGYHSIQLSSTNPP